MKPGWMETGWLPEFEFVEWPRLDQLRAEHESLLSAYNATLEAPVALRGRFASEDEQALASEREAAQTGADPVEVSMTPELRRRAKLEAAQAVVDEALTGLCAHVERTVKELLGHWHEVEAAFERESEERGIPKRPTVAEPPDQDGWSGLSVKQINERQDEKLEAQRKARRAAAKAIETLEGDAKAVSRLRNVTLSAHGANVLNEIERACPGVATGEAGAVLAGKALGEL